MNPLLLRAIPLGLLFLITLTGCDSGGDSGDSDTDRPVLAAVNAVPDMAEITFLREEEIWYALDYGVATDFRSVDADQYDLNFETRLPGDNVTNCAGDIDRDEIKDDNECTRLTTTSVNLLNGHEYVVALLGRYPSFDVTVYDKTIHEFDTDDEDGDPEDENMEVQFFHWSDTLGPVDVYLEPPGTNLSAVQVRTTLESGDEFHGLVDRGDYVLSLTPVGDPSNSLFTSENFSVGRQTRVAFAILNGSEDSTSEVRVARFRDQGGDLLDRRASTQLRVAHVATDVGNLDLFIQEDYTVPFLADLAYEETSEYLTVDPTNLSGLQFDITPAGNPGVLLTREQTSLTRGSRATFFLVTNSAGSLDGLNVRDHFRRLTPYAELRLINSAGASLDFYVIPHGNNVYTSTPTATLSTGSAGGLTLFDPGSYDIVMARAGTDTHVFGPFNVQLEGAGIYTVVAVPTTDTTRADAVLLDDFASAP